MLNPYYVTGFADGEGSFSVTVSPRKTLRTGWEIRPSFSISQNVASRGVLYQLKEFFKCGYVRPSRSDNTMKYEVRSLKELLERIIPHFEQYPLHTAKQKNFMIFKEIVQRMNREEHQVEEGLRGIVELLGRLNISCKKIYDRYKLQKLMNV